MEYGQSMDKVPKGNYKPFLSTSGLATSQWGPHAWAFLFACIHGAYPPKLDISNPEHVQIKKHFKQLFIGLQYTMPCVYCRNSYKQFIKDISIDQFLGGRIELMYWLYLVRDKVNKKLIYQEKDAFNSAKKELKKQYHESKISEKEYYSSIESTRMKLLKTKESPSFLSVLQRFESMRGKCSKEKKTCAEK